jgi:hypothetical protein
MVPPTIDGNDMERDRARRRRRCDQWRWRRRMAGGLDERVDGGL